LNALGTQDSPIAFNRPPDTTYYWQGIIFRNNSNGNLQHCQFSYGGKASEYGYDTSLINNLGATQLNMANCLFTNVQAAGDILFWRSARGDSFTIHSVMIKWLWNGWLVDQ
jgi:hypothetical protein